MITDEQIRQLQEKWVYVLRGNENEVHGFIQFAREVIALAQQVKPLMWVKHGDEWLAQTGFCIYQLKKDADGFWEVRIDIGVTSLLLITEPLDTIEQATELANEDYQRRVLQCLVHGGVS